MSNPMKYPCCNGYTQHDPSCEGRSYADTCIERAEKATFNGYTVFSNGRIFSNASNWRGYGKREMQQIPNSNGYARVRLTLNGERRNFFVHKLVCKLFHGAKPTANHIVRHLDGNKLNNAASNITWGTISENALDRQRHGTCKAAENGRKSAYKLRGKRRATQ